MDAKTRKLVDAAKQIIDRILADHSIPAPVALSALLEIKLYANDSGELLADRSEV
jgi:hypothetical protein